jgi:PAS domain S-box-containing protein
MATEGESPTTDSQSVLPVVRIVRDTDNFASLLRLEESGLFGAFEYDIVERTLSCSAEMLRRHGLDPEGPSHRFEEIWERIRPGDHDRLRRAAADGLLAGQFSAVYRVQTPGSPVRWMQAWARLQRCPAGAPVRWTGIVLDASASVIADALQQDGHAQIIELVGSIAESFVALDDDFRFTYVNDRVCERTGKSPEQLIGRNLWDLFPNATASEFYTGYQKVARERTRHTFLVSYNQPDGSHSWFEVHAFPTAEGIAALVRDVTELKKAREALEASEERFRRAQQAAKIGAFEWDLLTNELTWAVKVPTFTDVADTDDFPQYLRYVEPADQPLIFDGVRRVLAGGQHSIEIRIHPPDGRTLWFYIRGEALFDAEGKPLRVYGVAMDVTERKTAEEALRNSEKLAAAGKLAATIAHEINNPLEAVTNLLYLARSVTQPTNEAHTWLVQAEEELQRVAAIVRQTLGFYRGTTTATAVNLAALLREVLAVFRKRINENRIQIIESLTDLLRVVAVEGETRQILSNLISNAIDALAPGGTIWLSLSEQDAIARLEVRDNGRGIAPELRDRLFEPFFTTRSGAGTGLGLWVSRELARKNGGSLECDSAGEGQGAVFALTLPLA